MTSALETRLLSMRDLIDDALTGLISAEEAIDIITKHPPFPSNNTLQDKCHCGRRLFGICSGCLKRPSRCKTSEVCNAERQQIVDEAFGLGKKPPKGVSFAKS